MMVVNRAGIFSRVPKNVRVLAVLAAGVMAWSCGLSQFAYAQNPAKSSLPKIRIASDGRTFVTEDGRPFVPMGVNYYRPGTGWAPQVWKKFDAAATRQDFLRMKAAGVNCVRVFLTFGSFLMDPNNVSPEGLAKFDQFLAIAEEAGIYVHPTGPDHWEGLPAWAKGDQIADERVLAALENFWHKFAARYRGRSVIFAYDLRNEPMVSWDKAAVAAKWNPWLQSQYGSAAKMAQAWGVAPEKIQWGKQPPPSPNDLSNGKQLLDYQHFRESLADDWSCRQVKAIKSADPQSLVTVGFIQTSVPVQLANLPHYAAFCPRRQAKYLDFMEVHFYPGMPKYTDEAEQRNLADLESVVREVAATGKPTVVAEFGWYGGGSIFQNGKELPVVSEEQQAQWCRKLIETTRGFATGWLNWGFYDQPEANDCSQRTGLFTADGKPKAWSNEFRKLADLLAGKVTPPSKAGPRPTLDWDACLINPAAGRQFSKAYLKAFRADQSRPR